MITDNTRIIPVSKQNTVKTVTKLENKGLRIEFNSGKVIELDKDDELIQAFVVYTMLNDQVTA